MRNGAVSRAAGESAALPSEFSYINRFGWNRSIEPTQQGDGAAAARLRMRWLGGEEDADGYAALHTVGCAVVALIVRRVAAQGCCCCGRRRGWC